MAKKRNVKQGILAALSIPVGLAVIYGGAVYAPVATLVATLVAGMVFVFLVASEM